MKLHKQNQPANENELEEQAQVSDQLCQFNISESELRSAIQTIAKIKLIEKTKLSDLKKKHRLLNHTFKEMSGFFNAKMKRVEKICSDRKEQRKLRTEGRKKSLFFKSKNDPKKLREFCQNENLKQASNQDENSQQLKPQKSRCYICYDEYEKIDEIYHRHCPPCSEFSKMKRFQSADLSGLTALVTGGRIKIGYEIVLKLLKNGATVFATTRFTNDGLLRYQKEEDYEVWKDRLYLIQCDFLSAKQVEFLIKFIEERVLRLDILINNAAQTLTRPKQFYTYEIQNQQKQVPQNPHIISFHQCFYPSLQGQRTLAIQTKQSGGQINLNELDEFGQPLDLREKNTWKQKIEDVSLFDCVSTQIINSTVPFHIIGRLKHLMGGEKPSWIINVSSMEGVFYRKNKTCYHPQTNMAKAALNMITRTCAKDFSTSNIFMNSVDTGWVTNENPYQIAASIEKRYEFLPPLDCLEGAMRVLDPIYEGLRYNLYPWGKFFKNYKESNF